MQLTNFLRFFFYFVVAVRPTFVEIKLPAQYSSNQRPLVAGQNIEVKCQTGGSRPAPSITWWKGNKQIPPHLSAVTVSIASTLARSHAKALDVGHPEAPGSSQTNLQSIRFLSLLCFILPHTRRPRFYRIRTTEIWRRVDCLWRRLRTTMAATWFAASKIQWFQARSWRIRWNSTSIVSEMLCIQRKIFVFLLRRGVLSSIPALWNGISRSKLTSLLSFIVSSLVRCPDVDRSDPPEVGIALGSNINGDEVKEGDDLYIECHIRANPPFHKLQWTHNVSPVSPTVLSFLPFRPCLNGFLYICTAGCDDGACRPMNPFREWELSLSVKRATVCHFHSILFLHIAKRIKSHFFLSFVLFCFCRPSLSGVTVTHSAVAGI